MKTQLDVVAMVCMVRVGRVAREEVGRPDVREPLSRVVASPTTFDLTSYIFTSNIHLAWLDRMSATLRVKDKYY